MRSLSRVVWSEGMHLSQHHFQAQSRYFESLVGFAVSNLYFKPYGVVGYGLDAEALRNGTVSLSHARGVMPDGLPFHFPGDSTPAPIQIRDLFSPTHDSHVVLLAVPGYRAGEANCELDPERGAGPGGIRFSAAAEPVSDEVTGQEERAVTVGRKNFRLLLDHQATPELVTLALARVRRDHTGHFVYDPEFIPPSLQVGASARLMELLARLVEILDAKAAGLQAERRGTTAASVDYASREVAGFWLSHAIHAGLAPLRHLQHTRSAHPEQLYVEMARLAGALCTFSMSSDARTLPLYDHDALDRCFSALDRHIREHLEVILPTGALTIPLPPVARLYHGASVTDPRAMGSRHWYLGVRSSAPMALVAADVPRLVKVCSGGDDIRKLVERGLPGVPLEHVPSPPPEISPRIGTQYFRIGRSMPAPDGAPQPAPCWVRITQTAAVGVYVPAAIPDAELDLCVVLESG